MSSDKKSWNLVVRIDTNNADKPYWHTIGRAWESERNPGSFKIKINSLPVIPTTDLYLFPVRDEYERSEHPGKFCCDEYARAGTHAANCPARDVSPPHTDDEIPF